MRTYIKTLEMPYVLSAVDRALAQAYHQGKVEDYEYPDELVQEAMTHLPKVPAFG